MSGEPRRCLRCGGDVRGGHPSARRGICLDCAPTLLPFRLEGPADPIPAGGPAGVPFTSGFRLPEPGTDLGGIVIEGPLGSGGMGSVLAARDPGLERRVAVKFLREGFAGDPEFARRFRREGAALARISHPHVVRIFQVGEWRGAPYLVMELVEGRPLARLLDGGPLPLDQVLRIAGELAAALAAVHAARIIHRDVSPSNCLLRPGDHGLCLVDFGLARRLDRRTATSGRIAGTPLYMAPETVSGGAVDFRTDVYAFGVTLFEMATGAPPLEGEEMASFFRRVLHEDAPLLRTRRLDAPRGLEVLVARSLSRFPEFRPADGAALVEALRALRGGAAPPAADRVAEGDAAGAAVRAPPPHDPAEPLPLLGRHEEYGAALEALDAAVEGRGGVLLVEGPPGGGKSRFLREVERAARARAMEVLRCASAEYTGLPRRALRAMFLERDGEPAAGAGAILEEVRRDFPERRALLPALRWLLEEGGEAREMAPGRTEIRGAVLTLLRRLLARRPVLIAVEDAHHLDEGSLELLAAAAEEGRGWPLLLAATYRTADDPQRGPALEAWIHRVSALAQARVLRLAPLTEAAVAALIHRVLGVPEVEACRLAPVLHRKSDGNPLFLAESLRVLEQEGKAGPRARGKGMRERVSTLAIPPRLLELAVRRVSGLPHEERDALGVVAVDPLGVGCGLVERCLDLPRLTSLRVLQRLARDRGLVELRGDRYLVPHGEIREAVYGELFPELRAAYHAEAAQVLLAEGAAEREPGRVGRHLRLAGDGAGALPHLLRDGERLLRCFAPAEALERFEEALSCAGEPSPVEARVGKARALADLGEIDAARALFEEAAAGGRPAALLALAAFERDRGRTGAALDLLRRIREEDCDPGQRATLRLTLAQIFAFLNRNSEALAALDRAFEYEAQATRLERMHLWSTRGTTFWRLGRFREAKESFLEARGHAEEVGHTEGIAVILRNLSLVCVDLGEQEEAGQWAEKAVELATLMGSERTLAYAMLDLVDLRLRALRLDEAASLLGSVADPVRKAADLEARSIEVARRAELALARGDPEGALGQASEGMDLSGEFPAMLAGFLVLRARALLALGRPGEALSPAREAAATFEKTEDASGAEEATAQAARALRLIGREGPERERFRHLAGPLTVDGAIEAALEAGSEEDRLRRTAAAERIASDPWARAEVGARLGGPARA